MTLKLVTDSLAQAFNSLLQREHRPLNLTVSGAVLCAFVLSLLVLLIASLNSVLLAFVFLVLCAGYSGILLFFPFLVLYTSDTHIKEMAKDDQRVEEGHVERITRYGRIIGYFIFYILTFWFDKKLLLAYLFPPLAIICLFFHFLRLSLMLELALINPKFTMRECADKSWKLTENNEFGLAFSYLIYIVALFLIFYLPLSFMSSLNSKSEYLVCCTGPIVLMVLACMPIFVSWSISIFKTNIFYEFVGPMNFYSKTEFFTSQMEKEDADKRKQEEKRRLDEERRRAEQVAQERRRYEEEKRRQEAERKAAEERERKRKFAEEQERLNREAENRRKEEQARQQAQDTANPNFVFLHQIKELEKRGLYYEILGLRPGSSRTDVRKAYVHLIKRYHPDQNHPHEPHLTQISQILNHAKDELSK